MDDPYITMEEYIQLMADKAQKHGDTFNWETAIYGKVPCDDSDLFNDFEADFPAIVYNDASTSIDNVSSEPTISIYNAIKSNIDFSISYSDSEDEDYTFTYDKDSLFPKLIHVDILKPKPVNDYVEINTELCSKNIVIKPMDNIIFTNNDTTPIEFDENVETNHDTPVARYDNIVPDNQYAVSNKEDTAYPCLDYTKLPRRLKINTPYSKDPIRRIQDTVEEYSGSNRRYQRGPYSKKSPNTPYRRIPIRRIDPIPASTNRIPKLDFWECLTIFSKP
ncbi:hypothetical protein Tco_1457915 [Tanacetum coccineum]